MLISRGMKQAWFETLTAESHGWSWAYWQFDSDFILWDMKKDAWVEPVRQALVPAKR